MNSRTASRLCVGMAPETRSAPLPLRAAANHLLALLLFLLLLRVPMYLDRNLLIENRQPHAHRLPRRRIAVRMRFLGQREGLVYGSVFFLDAERDRVRSEERRVGKECRSRW